MSIYVKRQNGEGWTIRNREPFRVGCCDCGLVHNMVVTVSGKRRGTVIGIAAERNERATGQKRRRNQAIIVARSRGETTRAIAARFDISQQRVSQIVAAPARSQRGKARSTAEARQARRHTTLG